MPVTECRVIYTTVWEGKILQAKSQKSRCYKSTDEYLPRFQVVSVHPGSESDLNNEKRTVGQEKDKPSLIYSNHYSYVQY